MVTILAIRRVKAGKWQLRVARADDKGNVVATAPVEGSLDLVRALATKAVGAWALVDEIGARSAAWFNSRRGLFDGRP